MYENKTKKQMLYIENIKMYKHQIQFATINYTFLLYITYITIYYLFIIHISYVILLYIFKQYL